jgi:hypothetical protein
MSFTLPFTYSWYEGVGTSVDVPARFDVALNGRGYMIDTMHSSFKEGLATIPLIRQQADNSEEPGESTINPEDLWPRSQSTWHLGAGQEYLDAPDSTRARFRSSLGIDPWTRGQLKPLHTVENVYDTAAANLAILRVGTYVYVVDNNSLKFADTPYTGWSTVDIFGLETPQSVKSIASDGHTIYAALGSAGINTTVAGELTSTDFSDLSATLIAYVKGRIMAANGHDIYNVTAAGAAPSALFSHPNTDFTWVGFAPGPGQIYAAGYSGDKSLIYRIPIKTDGTGLDVPLVAAELPDGEVVTAIGGYLGFVTVGTTEGFRLAVADGEGNLTLGALVKTGNSVRSFEPQDRFMWFGWEDRDEFRSGLGRMDLSAFTSDNVPAYASDLMAGVEGDPVQGPVESIVTTYENQRMFTVAGSGVFLETAEAVTDAYLDTGKINYGIPDSKIALRLSMKHQALAAEGSVGIYVSADERPFSLVGLSNTITSVAPLEALKVPEVAAQFFELRIVLNGPETVFERYDFRSYPAAQRGMTIIVPLLLHEEVTTAIDKRQPMDPRSEYDYIESYVGLPRLISYQELGYAYSVFVEGIQLVRHSVTKDRRWWNGTLLVKMKVLG